MIRSLTFIFLLLLSFSDMASECDKGHWVQKSMSDGSIVILEEGSTWEIAPIDRTYTVNWLPETKITACEAKLINVNAGGGEVAEAIRIK